MYVFEKIKFYYQNPKVFKLVALEHLSPFLSTSAYIKIRWKIRMGYSIDLNNPQTFNEKLQWLKVNYRNPLYTTLVDKFCVKKYVEEKIGSEYVVPLIDSWDSVDDIDWVKLPNQFVIKCSHDCGGMVICKDKSKLDIEGAKRKLKKCLRTNYYWKSREWPYRGVKHKIFCESYMEDEHGELRDYKFFCFNGEPKVLFVASERQKKDEETKFDFFDMDFNHLPFTNGHPNSSAVIEQPEGFEKMKELAAILSQGMPQVRVDFYNVNGHIYFGEFTFFHWGGMTPFTPKEWDYKLGSWIELPKRNINRIAEF